MTENIPELTTVNRAEMQGWFCRKVIWAGRKNAPDRLFIKGGRTVWIEFKRDSKTAARKTQVREHNRMLAAGADVYVLGTYDDAAKVLGLT